MVAALPATGGWKIVGVSDVVAEPAHKAHTHQALEPLGFEQGVAQPQLTFQRKALGVGPQILYVTNEATPYGIGVVLHRLDVNAGKQPKSKNQPPRPQHVHIGQQRHHQIVDFASELIFNPFLKNVTGGTPIAQPQILQSGAKTQACVVGVVQLHARQVGMAAVVEVGAFVTFAYRRDGPQLGSHA